MAAATDVRLATPVEKLEAWGGRQQHLAGGAATQRRPGARKRVGIGGGQQTAVLNGRIEHGERTVDAPGQAARVEDVPARRAGGEAQLAAQRARDDALARRIAGIALEPQNEVDAVDSERAGDNRGTHRVAL